MPRTIAGSLDADAHPVTAKASASPSAARMNPVPIDCFLLRRSYPVGMPQVRVDVISIGTLSRNLLWKETEPVRTAHATCTLVRTDKRNILVDPGLPGQVLAARLYERAGLKVDAIDTIEFEDVSYEYELGRRALSGINLAFRRGESIGIIGASGGGKSGTSSGGCDGLSLDG